MNHYIEDRNTELRLLETWLDTLPRGDMYAKFSRLAQEIREKLCEMEGRITKGKPTDTTEKIVDALFNQTEK